MCETNNNFTKFLFSGDWKKTFEMSDEYEHVARGKLKLKTDSNKVSKKKKKKDKKEREKLERELEERQHIPQAPVRQMTKAELSFKKMQEKMVSIDWNWFELKWTK